jgi:DNA-directed RNA polymerase specialized sigma24 family protein
MNTNDQEAIDSSVLVAGPDTPANDPPEDINVLVAHAAQGDRRAIGAIAVTYGPLLVRIAREEVRHEEDAEDIVQDLYERLLEGRAARFLPRKGQGLSWLRGLVRALARTRRKGGRPRR